MLELENRLSPDFRSSTFVAALKSAMRSASMEVASLQGDGLDGPAAFKQVREYARRDRTKSVRSFFGSLKSRIAAMKLPATSDLSESTPMTLRQALKHFDAGHDE